MTCFCEELIDYKSPENNSKLTTWQENEVEVKGWTDEHTKAFSYKTNRSEYPIPITSIRDYKLTLDMIEASKAITLLPNNWDEEGSAGYSMRTWMRATDFLRKQATLAKEEGESIGVPTISPASNGSIDIYWRQLKGGLLLNFPENDQEPASYYGEQAKGDTISGVLSTEAARPDFIAWLTQIR
jgi:hypothetical protein